MGIAKFYGELLLNDEPITPGSGAPGAPGADGTRGSLWYWGAGAPGTIAGALANDQYRNTSNDDVYAYVGSTWSLTGNIKGDTGLPGTNGLPGAPGADGADAILTISQDGTIVSSGTALEINLQAGLSATDSGGTINLSGTGIQFFEGTTSLGYNLGFEAGNNASFSLDTVTGRVKLDVTSPGVTAVRGTNGITGSISTGTLILSGTLLEAVQGTTTITGVLGFVGGSNVSMSGTSGGFVTINASASGGSLVIENAGTSIGTAGTINAGSGLSAAVAGGVASFSVTGTSGNSYTPPLASGFTSLNTPAGSTFSDTSTGLSMTTPNASSFSLFALKSNTSVGSTFTITAGFNFSFQNNNSNNVGAGIFVGDASGKLVNWFQYNLNMQGASQYLNSTTSFNTNPFFAASGPPIFGFFRIRYDGTNFYFYSGADRNALVLQKTLSATGFISTPNKVGLSLYGAGGSSYLPPSAVFYDWEQTA